MPHQSRHEANTAHRRPPFRFVAVLAQAPTSLRFKPPVTAEGLRSRRDTGDNNKGMATVPAGTGARALRTTLRRGFPLRLGHCAGSHIRNGRCRLRHMHRAGLGGIPPTPFAKPEA
jgi:hypothetical protein